MAISAAGIIFSSLNNNTLSRLTKDRTVAAIPFACRYRLIDFGLSNMVNAGITNINVIANYNYRSLLEHIGSGKDWDLARRSGGINIISPYQTATNSSQTMFSTRMEALISMKEYIDEFKEEYVILADSDFVLNLDLKEVIAGHEKSSASITFVTRVLSPGYTSKTPKMMLSSMLGKITDISINSSYNPNNPELVLNIFVMKTSYLRTLIEEAQARSLGSLTQILISRVKREDYRTYCYGGYVAAVSSFLDYYRCSLELAMNEDARASLLYKKEAPIYTRVHNSAPASHRADAKVKSSIIADECVIEGTVINSVLFRGVHVGKGALVKDSVLFHGTYVDKNASLNCIVTDKNVHITEGVRLSGNENMPFYVQKNRKV